MKKLFVRSLFACVSLAACIVNICPQTPNMYDAERPSRLRPMIESFGEDRGFLNRFYTAQTSPNRAARFRELYGNELKSLEALNFDQLTHDEQIDYIVFNNYLDHELKELARTQAQLAEMAELIPFAKTISDLEDTRRTLKD